MLDSIIPLLGSFVSSQIWTYFFIPLIGLFFLATVPKIIRYFIGVGGH